MCGEGRRDLGPSRRVLPLQRFGRGLRGAEGEAKDDEETKVGKSLPSLRTSSYAHIERQLR